jgi:hypothetical protein
MPLMMHGVPFYQWRICVQAPDHTTQIIKLAEEVTTLRIELEPGDQEQTCEQALPMMPPDVVR